jgi:hypothetical protein
MRGTLWSSSLVVLGVVLAGCSDTGVVEPGLKPSPTGPVANLAYKHGEYDGSVPRYASEGEVIFPEVYNRTPFVYWNGANAVAASEMNYWGNRAEETFQMTITGIAPGSGGRTAKSESYGGWWPDYYRHTTPGFSSAAGSSCGNLVNIATQHTAKFVFFIDYKGFTSLEKTVPDGANSLQEACPTEEKEEEYPDGSGGGYSDSCPECLDKPEWCTVFYMYDKATGAILWYQVLWCN